MVSKTVYKNRAEWLAARNEAPGLGSSDVGTIMGLNPYCTPYQYWLKQKQVKDFEEENERLFHGQFHEDAIAKDFEARTGEKIVKRSAEIEVYRNDKYPEYVQVAPDRVLFAKGRDTRVVAEVKDSRRHLDSLDPSQVADWYSQVMYQMGVMELASGYLIVDNYSKELVYREYPFDADYFEHIMHYCCAWFDRYIIGNEMPPLETAEDALIAFPVSEARAKEVDESIAETVVKLKGKKAELKALESEISDLENIIKVAFEDNEAIEYNGNSLATWKTVETTRIDTERLKIECPEIVDKYKKTTISRTLRLKK